MSDFVKPRTQYVADKEYIEKLVNATLRKDLHDNEEICPYCHGTGLVIRDNPYGLSDDPDKKSGVFPYTHQSVIFCPHCYNGVIHICEKCGEIIPKGFLRHDCKDEQELKRKEYAQRRKNALKNAPDATPEILENSLWFCSDDYGYNDGYFEEWEEFFEYWHEYHDEDERPEFVWATEPVDISINASDIVSNATEDLYEDAYDDVSSKSIKELQDYLDNWCKTCGIRTTYYESKYKVRIPWEKYDV